MGLVRSGASAGRQWVRPWLIAILLLGFALRVHELARQNIWWDEARNLAVALRPLSQIATAPELDIHPPVYFWLLHLWSRAAGLTVGMDPAVLAYAGRFFSVAAGLAGVALLYVLGQLAAGSGAGALAALLGGLSPFWLAESQESRMYTLGFGWLLGAAVAFWSAQSAASEDGRRRGLVAFVGLSALALLTHYNAVFVLAAWYGWWFVAAWRADKRGAELRRWFSCGLATALLALPVAPIALRQIPGYANPNLAVPGMADYLRQNWQAYIGGYAFTPELGQGLGNLWLVVVLALGLGGALLATATGMGRTRLLLFLWSWLAGSLALYYLAVLDRGAFNVRYASFVTPALYTLLAVGLALWGRRRVLAVAATALVLALWPQAIYADLYDPRFAREDIAAVAGWLRTHAGPEDVIFVDQKYPFGFYYKRYAIEPEETPTGPESAPARYLFVDINTVAERLNEWAANAERVYWLQWFESDTDPRRAVAFLLDQNGQRGGEEWFQGYSIDWWELDPPNHFVLAPELQPMTIVFPPAVQTVEVSLPPAEVPLGRPLPVVIRWQRVPGGSVTRPLKARVALYDGDGARLAQRDERLLNDRHLLPAEWGEEDRPFNVYLLEPPDDLPPGEYSIGLLVYDADTLEPLGLVDAAGNPAGVEATLGVVRLIRP
ncbi:MAG TPA: glycosyltransferase family 39 protein [Caldilineaceae bacterium]|nr:glycosyltransferase family 39 protein [Caldilineaceae bacterium]